MDTIILAEKAKFTRKAIESMICAKLPFLVVMSENGKDSFVEINGCTRYTGDYVNLSDLFYGLSKLCPDCTLVHYSDRENWYHVFQSQDYINSIRSMALDHTGQMFYHPEIFPTR